jgi:HEAT repeat protein
VWPHELPQLTTVYSLLLGTFGVSWVIAGLSGERAGPTRVLGIAIVALWLWMPLYFLSAPLHHLFLFLRPSFRVFLFYLFHAVALVVLLGCVIEMLGTWADRRAAPGWHHPIGGHLFWLAPALAILFSVKGHWRVAVPSGVALMVLGFLIDKSLEKRAKERLASAQREATVRAEAAFQTSVVQRCDRVIADAEFGRFLDIIRDIERQKAPLAPQVLGKIDEFARTHGIVSVVTALQDPAWRASLRYLTKVLRSFAEEGRFAHPGDPAVVERLGAALDHPKSDVRLIVIGALGQSQDTRSAEPLLARLTDPVPGVRVAVAEALANLGHPGWRDVIEGDQDDLRRIAGSGHPAAFDMLVHALHGPDDGIRAAAVHALGELGDARAVEELVTAWRDEKRRLDRGAMVSSLKHCVDPNSVPALLSLLPNWEIRTDIKAIVAGLADARVVDHLLNALAEGSPTPSEALRGVLEIAGMIGDRRLADRLATFIRQAESQDLRVTALESLENQPDTDVVSLLVELLDSGQQADQRFAAEALVRRADRRAADPLWRLVNRQGDPAVRTHAICALARLGDLRVAECVVEALFECQTHPALAHSEALFGDYCALVRHAADGVTQVQTGCYRGASGNEDEHYSYRSEVGDKRAAVRQLCALQTPVATNLLHKVAQLADRKVCEQDGYYGATFAQISFEDLRQQAREELKRRKDPPYDAAAYLLRENWRR